MTTSTKALLSFFSYAHLPPRLQAISKPFGELAEFIAQGPPNDETEVALRKLLESKDCAVRATLSKDQVAERAPGPPDPPATPGHHPVG